MVVGVDVAITIIVSVVASAIITFLASARTIKSMSSEIIRGSISITNEIAHKFISLGYAQSKASKEGRVLSLEDMKEGLDFADKVLKARA